MFSVSEGEIIFSFDSVRQISAMLMLSFDVVSLTSFTFSASTSTSSLSISLLLTGISEIFGFVIGRRRVRSECSPSCVVAGGGGVISELGLSEMGLELPSGRWGVLVGRVIPRVVGGASVFSSGEVRKISLGSASTTLVMLSYDVSSLSSLSSSGFCS